MELHACTTGGKGGVTRERGRLDEFGRVRTRDRWGGVTRERADLSGRMTWKCVILPKFNRLRTGK